MQTDEPESRRAQAPPSPSGWPEARFRIPAANGSPRTVQVIFLNDADPDVAFCRSRVPRPYVRFSGPADFRASVGTDAIRPERLERWLATPDLVVIVGDEGNDPALGILAARAYRDRPISISGLIRGRGGSASPGSRTSDALRPLCTTMILVNDTGYLGDLLDALGVSE